MGPVLKVKRLKKSISPKSNAVAKPKQKWENPKKSISAQPGIMKIKNVKKRSFDPIKANRGVVLLKNIPHGFYEDEMRSYFGQFGLVTRVRLARSERTGRSKGYAYIEFKVPEVAEIAADTMNNYIMFKHVLKSVYIPPDQQKYNFFHKDVTFTVDENGEKSYSSAKTKRVEKEIEKINRVPTDEEHAKRIKRAQKILQKQQKKYGIDLSNVMVSGNSSSEVAAPAIKEPTETKKKVKTVKTTEEKKLAKSENKIVKKKEKKNVDSDASSNNGKSLLGKLLNDTYDTDTSDDDFEIDNTLSASADESDDAPTLVDILAQRLKKANNGKSHSFMETSRNSDSDDNESGDDEQPEEEDSADDWPVDEGSENDESVEEESEEEEPEIVMPTKAKKLNKGVVSNGTKNSNTKAGLKRKLESSGESMFNGLASSSSQSDPLPKKKNKKMMSSEISSSEPEAAAKATPKNISTNTSSSSEPALSKKLQKNKKPALVKENTATLTTTETNSTEPDGKTKKLKKKKQLAAATDKKSSNSSLTDTTSSEPELPKQNMKKNKLKQRADLENAAEQEKLDVKAKKANKQSPNDKIASNDVAGSSQPKNLKQKMKKNQPTNPDEKIVSKSTTTSSGPELQTLKKKKQKTAADNGLISLNAESVKMEKKVENKMEKKMKKQKPVTSSLISGNGIGKKSKKQKMKQSSGNQATKTAWSTVSETDGDDVKEVKTKGISGLKTIVRKNIPTKKGIDAKAQNVNKIKQTPGELLQVVSSKTVKQTNQMKSKKKSK